MRSISSHESKVALIASGSEVELAIETQKILKDNKVGLKGSFYTVPRII